LAFLFFVEEPHIKRTYGSGQSLDRGKMKVLYDPKSGWFPDKKDNIFLADVDLFRSGDMAVVLFSAYALLLAFLPTAPVWSLAQVGFWRTFHWGALGTILWAQSKWGSWNNHFTARGRTIYEAFGHWKNTYNMSLTLNLVSFVAASIRYSLIDWDNSNLISPRWIACLAVGGVLIALSVWSFLSTWEAVGEFGWFYGDFFVPPENFRTQLCYTGIYRFLNNPDAVTGYAGQYGAAIISQRWEIFIVAVASHVMNMIFLQLVRKWRVAEKHHSLGMVGHLKAPVLSSCAHSLCSLHFSCLHPLFRWRPLTCLACTARRRCVSNPHSPKL
jgi:phosphatidylethanolamine N-methyltransferase